MPGSRIRRAGEIPAASATQGPVEKAAHIRDDVEAGIDAVAIVHQHRRRAGFGDYISHSGIALQSPNIIDDAGAEFRRTAGDFSLGRINRKRKIDGPRQFSKNGLNARKLLFRCDGRMPRPGQFGSHIDNVGTLGREFLCLMHGGLQAKEFAAVGEGIGRDIQYAHEERPRAQEPEKPVAPVKQGGTLGPRGGSLASLNHASNDP